MNDCQVPPNEDQQKTENQPCDQGPIENVSNDCGISDSNSENVTQPVSISTGSTSKMLKDKVVNFFRGIIARQIIQKVFTLVFALVVFSFAYMQMTAHRNILTYMGVMLLMVLVYAEILVIRDHLWVIEGSMRESRKWRDVFFNQTAMRRQRLRKFIILIFSMAIFSYIIIKSSGKLDPVLTFMGIILMITVLYYEVLNIRDEVWLMMQSISGTQKDMDEKRKEVYEKFIAEGSDKNIEEIRPAPDAESTETHEINNDEKI